MWGGVTDPRRYLQQDGPADRFALAASLPLPALMQRLDRLESPEVATVLPGSLARARASRMV